MKNRLSACILALSAASCSIFGGDTVLVSITSPSEGDAFSFRTVWTNSVNAVTATGTWTIRDIVTNTNYYLVVKGIASTGTNSGADKTLTAAGDDGSFSSYPILAGLFGEWEREITLPCVFGSNVSYALTAMIIQNTLTPVSSTTNVTLSGGSPVTDISWVYATNATTNSDTVHFSVRYSK